MKKLAILLLLVSCEPPHKDLYWHCPACQLQSCQTQISTWDESKLGEAIAAHYKAMHQGVRPPILDGFPK